MVTLVVVPRDVQIAGPEECLNILEGQGILLCMYNTYIRLGECVSSHYNTYTVGIRRDCVCPEFLTNHFMRKTNVFKGRLYRSPAPNLREQRQKSKHAVCLLNLTEFS